MRAVKNEKALALLVGMASNGTVMSIKGHSRENAESYGNDNCLTYIVWDSGFETVCQFTAGTLVDASQTTIWQTYPQVLLLKHKQYFRLIYFTV